MEFANAAPFFDVILLAKCYLPKENRPFFSYGSDV